MLLHAPARRFLGLLKLSGAFLVKRNHQKSNEEDKAAKYALLFKHRLKTKRREKC